MKYSVIFSVTAQRDFADLLTYLVPTAGAIVARGYVGRLRSYCMGFGTFPHRGSLRDDMPPGVRIVGFERSATIAFIIVDRTVTILRVVPRGMDLRIVI